MLSVIKPFSLFTSRRIKGRAINRTMASKEESTMTSYRVAGFAQLDASKRPKQMPADAHIADPSKITPASTRPTIVCELLSQPLVTRLGLR